MSRPGVSSSRRRPKSRSAPCCDSGTGGHTSCLRAASVPERWACPGCGWLAGRDEATPPPPPQLEPYKPHLAYVKERRSEEDAEAILNEALEDLRNDPF